MAIFTRVLLILCLCGAAFTAGWYSKEAKTVVQTKVEEVEKIITRTVTVKEPNKDGTVTETTTTETAEERSKPDPVLVKALTKNNWGLGVTFNPANFYADKPNYYPTGVQLERRILGGFWGSLQYQIEHKEIQVGIKYQF